MCTKSPCSIALFEDSQLVYSLLYIYMYVAAYKFQENLLHTMMQIENTFFDLATTCSTNCLVICDRGTMDATACECFAELAANLIHFQVINFLSERASCDYRQCILTWINFT